MGSANASSAKDPPKLSEAEYLTQAQIFIKENKICQPSDQATFRWIQLVIAKISIYGHKHMLDHLRRCTDRQTKLTYLEKWKYIRFEHLDHVFQNLIRSKITKSEEDQVFTKIDTHQKYSFNDREQLRKITQRGEDIIRKMKVAVIIFVGNSSTKSQEVFDKEFYKQSPKDQCLFQIIMARLQQIGNRYGFPPTYLFYNYSNEDKVTKFLKKYKYGQKIHCCLQSTQPVLNLNGNICLKAKDSPDVIEMPNGSGDFYNTSVKGMGILQKMRRDGVEYVSCCDCENILESVLDPYIVGLLEANKTEYDLMYKCTYPENQKDRIFRRVVLQNGSLKADTIQDLTTIANYNSKQRTISMQNIRESPVWINSVVFQVESVLKVISSADSMSIFPQAVNYKITLMSYWSPVDVAMRNNQSCYVFQKQLSDLLINNLFKSKGIMVDRDEQYLPVITENKEFSWRDAYKEFKRKLDKNLLVPFYERIQSPNMLESLIRSDEYDHKRPN